MYAKTSALLTLSHCARTHYFLTHQIYHPNLCSQIVLHVLTNPRSVPAADPLVLLYLIGLRRGKVCS
ncbi:hypothetical protein AAHA92_00730 [Salvia divinorum]|uniref:Uncharacterized protein n=1 Tax=Salvia divinorum TaxID=28513 RepID=A0ABD1IKJ1_SALDI